MIDAFFYLPGAQRFFSNPGDMRSSTCQRAGKERIFSLFSYQRRAGMLIFFKFICRVVYTFISPIIENPPAEYINIANPAQAGL
jgi:hypothetical protein